MKKIFILLLVISLGFEVRNLQAQGLTNVIVEKYYISDANDSSGSVGNIPVGSVTYRIFVEMKPGYTFEAAYGINSPLHELRLATTTSFFNNEDRGSTTANAIANKYLKNNTVMLDSWLSVGAGSAGNLGVLKGDDTNGGTANSDGLLQNTDANAGIPLKTEDGLIPGTPPAVTTVGIDNDITVFDNVSDAGNLFSTTNGSWACLGGALGPTPDNRVLIAQITTDGVFSFELNIQIGTPGPNSNAENYVAKNPVGTEMQRDFLTYSSATSNMNPIVSITSPADSSVFSSGDVVNITAKAFDPDGTVSSVEFFIDGVSIGNVNSAPYTANYTGVPGKHSLTAVATDNKGAKTTSTIVTITVGPLGINQLTSNNEQLTIYPNPIKDVLNLSFINRQQATGNRQQEYNYLTIYNSQGILVFHKELSIRSGKYNDRIDMSSFANGLYILECSINGLASSRKIIKY